MKNLNSVLIILLFAVNLLSCTDKKQPETLEYNENTPPAKKVLFVLTSHDKMGDTGEKTGFWLEEFTTPYYYLLGNNIQIILASPKGGRPPIDPRSELPKNQTESTERFNNDPVAQEQLDHTKVLANMDQADFDAVFYPGGYGPLWDLATDSNSIRLIENFIKNNKPVSAVCHGPAVFKETKNPDGSYLVKGKKVTGFSDSEEEAAGFTKVVPFLLEDMLKDNGGIYSQAHDWQPYVEEDGLLITGQNPKSAELVAQALLAKLRN